MNRPNILLITTDQMRADAMGCAGHPCARTPHLDLLAAEGTRFAQAHADCPVCIPCRTTMVTGLQSHHYGMPEFAPAHRISRPRESFLGSLITAAGYQTCLIGKSHWHTAPSFRGGFETWVRFAALERERLALPRGTWPGIGANELAPALSPFPPELCSTNWCVTRALDFLADRERDQPFFLWMSLIDPHPPNVIHEPYYSMYDGEEIPTPVLPDWAQDGRAPHSLRMIRHGNAHATMTAGGLRKARGVYYGMITNIDHQIGRILGSLHRDGLLETTLVLFLSDHGEMLGDYGTCFKATMLDSSVRLPWIVRFPECLGEVARGVVSDALVQPADILPTLCEVAGAGIPADGDGTSLLPIIRGQAANIRTHLHGQIGNDHFWHDGRFKYLYFADDGRELVFDKSSDPLDERDLSADYRLTGRLRAEFVEHLRAEKHPHISGSGELANLRTPDPALGTANVLRWMGLGART